jgi:hypothetical protein
MLTYRTETCWAREMTTDELAKVNAKLAELVTQGKTDGVRHESDMMPGGWTTVERHWTTEEDAKNWLEFFADFFPPVRKSRITAIE